MSRPSCASALSLRRETSPVGRRAAELADQAIDLAQATGDPHAVATERFRSALGQVQAAGAHVGMALGLEALASMAIWHGDPTRPAKLASAADSLRVGIGGGVSITVAGRLPPLEEARATLDAAAFQQAALEGRALAPHQAVALALESGQPGRR